MIPEKLKKIKVFTYKEALLAGLTKDALEGLVRAEKIDRVTRGIYNIIDETLDQESIFSAACKVARFPCSICFWSALVYYDLTDEIDRETWVMVPLSRRTSYKRIRLARLKNPKWNIGISKEQGYWITTLERTIVDSLAYPRFVGTMAATLALKKALKLKKTNISKIVEMASSLGCLKKIYPRLEAFIE